MKDFIKNREKYYDITLFSSFLYLIGAMVVVRYDEWLSTFLFLIFITSIFYHSQSKNIYFRIADWLASLSLIFYLGKLVIFNISDFSYLAIFLFLVLLLSIISFLTSLVAYKEKSYVIYNLSHSLWHLSSIILILIFFFAR